MGVLFVGSSQGSGSFVQLGSYERQAAELVPSAGDRAMNSQNALVSLGRR